MWSWIFLGVGYLAVVHGIFAGRQFFAARFSQGLRSRPRGWSRIMRREISTASLFGGGTKPHTVSSCSIILGCQCCGGGGLYRSALAFLDVSQFFLECRRWRRGRSPDYCGAIENVGRRSVTASYSTLRHDPERRPRRYRQRLRREASGPRFVHDHRVPHDVAMHGPRGDEVIMIYDRNVRPVHVGNVLMVALAVAPFPPRNVTIARM